MNEKKRLVEYLNEKEIIVLQVCSIVILLDITLISNLIINRAFGLTKVQFLEFLVMTILYFLPSILRKNIKSKKIKNEKAKKWVATVEKIIQFILFLCRNLILFSIFLGLFHFVQ